MLRPLLEPELIPLGMTLRGLEWERLERLGELWLQYGRVINLTGARQKESLAEQVMEGLLATECVKRAGAEGTWLDVGSGAGFPGLVAVARGFDVVLTEPRDRRVGFLRLAVGALGGGARVVRTRLEDVTWVKSGVDEVEWLDKSEFGVVSARAVMAPNQWLSKGLRLVRPGGLVLVHATRTWRTHVEPHVFMDWREWRVSGFRAWPNLGAGAEP